MNNDRPVLGKKFSTGSRQSTLWISFLIGVFIIVGSYNTMFLLRVPVPKAITETTSTKQPEVIIQTQEPVTKPFVDKFLSKKYLYPKKFPELKADESKRKEIVEAFLNAWNTYKKHAWGTDFLNPISQRGEYVFSGGLTITDSLDTMYLMGLYDEFNKSKEWVKKNFKMQGKYSVFEIVIRHLGSFLSTYQLTGDRLFLEKAQHVADAIIPLFKENTGFFRTYANFNTDANGKVTATPHGNEEALISDLGSIQLEFFTLSYLTGDDKYAKAGSKIYSFLFKHYKNNDLYPERISTINGNSFSNVQSIDSMSDSFYEYLIKVWIMTNDTQPVIFDRYMRTAKAIKNQLLVQVDGWTYITRLTNGLKDYMMTHLATFAAGMLAVGAVKKNPDYLNHLELADKLVTTYLKLYNSQSTGLMPECVRFDRSSSRFSTCDDAYRLRPETIESIYVLYRFTGLQKYRDYAWTIYQNIMKYCKIASGGFASVENTNRTPPRHIDLMDSYFLAETLKYLFLIFSDSNVLPTDEWVFNTEAHPLRIWSNEEALNMKTMINIQE